jgi:hypothetical protein
MTEDSSKIKDQSSLQSKAAEPSAQLSDDALIDQFFSQARTMEIADDGFTDRVMHRLPDRAIQLSRLWTLFCIVLGTVLIIGFMVFQGWLPVVLWLNDLVHETFTYARPLPIFVTMGALCSLAVAELANRLYAEC